MRRWAATNTAAVFVIWLFCAAMTVYIGLWKGELLSAPGSEDWAPEGKKDEEEKDERKKP